MRVCVVCATCKHETQCLLMSIPLLPSSSGARRGEADGGTNTGVGRSATTGQGGAAAPTTLAIRAKKRTHHPQKHSKSRGSKTFIYIYLGTVI